MDCPKVLSQVEGPNSYKELCRVGDGAVGEGIAKRFAASTSLQTSGAVCTVSSYTDNLCAVGRLGSCVWHPSEGGKDKEEGDDRRHRAVTLGRYDPHCRPYVELS